MYVIREVISGTILAAKNLKSSASDELKDFISPIVDWRYPIKGFISDGLGMRIIELRKSHGHLGSLSIPSKEDL